MFNCCDNHKNEFTELRSGLQFKKNGDNRIEVSFLLKGLEFVELRCRNYHNLMCIFKKT